MKKFITASLAAMVLTSFSGCLFDDDDEVVTRTSTTRSVHAAPIGVTTETQTRTFEAD